MDWCRYKGSQDKDLLEACFGQLALDVVDVGVVVVVAAATLSLCVLEGGCCCGCGCGCGCSCSCACRGRPFFVSAVHSLAILAQGTPSFAV